MCLGIVRGAMKLKNKEKDVPYSRKDYEQALEQFDIAVCEACAVSQASGGRYDVPGHHQFGTRIFTGICATAVALIRAAPLSRWTRSDFQHWAFCSIAAYTRAIFEGYILISYLMETPKSPEELELKMLVMHLNDCMRRVNLHKNLGDVNEADKFKDDIESLKAPILESSYFKQLAAHEQKSCLSGESVMIVSRVEMLDKLKWDRGQFRAVYDLLSQHAHILPMSFYRMEEEGRGTGLENDTDRGYMCMMLEMCAGALSECTDLIVLAFPDTADRRKGKKSTFSPGPRGNLPRSKHKSS